MDFKNFKFKTSDFFPEWALFFLELGHFSSSFAANQSSSKEKLSITLTVPGAEYASALIAIGANIQAINSDDELKKDSSSSGLLNLNTLSYNDEVMMRFDRLDRTTKGFYKRRLKKDDGMRYFQFSESRKATEDNRFKEIPEGDVSKLVFPKGTSIDLIDLPPLLRICCKDINYELMLAKKECITTLLGIKSHAFEESQENLFYTENDLLVGGHFNDIARFQNENKLATGFYSRIFSDFKGASITKSLAAMNENKSRILILTSKSINTLSLGEITGEKVRINLLDRSKNIISLGDSLAKINQGVAATGGQNLNFKDYLNFPIPNSIEIALQTVRT